MTMRQALLGFSRLLLAGAAQFSISSNVSAQQADLRAKVFTQSPAVRAAVEVRAESARQARALAYPPFLHSSGIGHYSCFRCPRRRARHLSHEYQPGRDDHGTVH